MTGRAKPLAAALEELAGKKATVNVNVRLRGATDGDDEFETGRRGDALSPQMKSALRKLRGQDAQVMEWLQGDAARPAEFLANPVEALRQAGVRLDATTLATLRGASQGMKLPGHVRLGKVRVQVRGGGR